MTSSSWSCCCLLMFLPPPLSPLLARSSLFEGSHRHHLFHSPFPFCYLLLFLLLFSPTYCSTVLFFTNCSASLSSIFPLIVRDISSTSFFSYYSVSSKPLPHPSLQFHFSPVLLLLGRLIFISSLFDISHLHHIFLPLPFLAYCCFPSPSFSSFISFLTSSCSSFLSSTFSLIARNISSFSSFSYYLSLFFLRIFSPIFRSYHFIFHQLFFCIVFYLSCHCSKYLTDGIIYFFLLFIFLFLFFFSNPLCLSFSSIILFFYQFSSSSSFSSHCSK